MIELTRLFHLYFYMPYYMDEKKGNSEPKTTALSRQLGVTGYKHCSCLFENQTILGSSRVVKILFCVCLPNCFGQSCTKYVFHNSPSVGARMCR
jgi:hypothetical protein